MSDIFYSEVDKNLQKELNARASAGRYDRSDTAIAYMTEKIANVQLTAYAEGSKRDKTKIVHTLGGKSVLTDEFLPSGDYGYLTTRPYTLKDTKWAITSNEKYILNSADPVQYQRTIDVNQKDTNNSFNNESYRIPPHITSADLQINDSSRGITNKATINMMIPNPSRDLNFMESIYARPGRYCLLEFEHPDSALMTLTGSNSTAGLLSEDALPSRKILKQQYPEAEAEFDRLRRMNLVQFEGVITSFEYAYQTDGTISMTIYLLGTSMVYTDLSLIMQTAADTGSSATGSADPAVDKATAFYKFLVDAVYNVKVAAGDEAEETKRKLLVDGIHEYPIIDINEPGWAAWGICRDQVYRDYINLNFLLNMLSTKILSKIPGEGELQPKIYCDQYHTVFSNRLEFLCSSNPAEIWLPKPESDNQNRQVQDTDCYGTITVSDNQPKGIPWIKTSPTGFFMNSDEQTEWSDYLDIIFPDDVNQRKKLDSYRRLGRPGCIMINLTTIEKIIKGLAADKDKFTVKEFLEQISNKINSATGGAIDMKLVTDPDYPNILYYRDINCIGSPESVKSLEPYEVPMFQNHPLGTIVRDFKFSAKLPSNVQSLMYTLNSAQNVSEEQIAPYIRFMYNNAAVTRDGNVETSTYGSKEIVEKLATDYLTLHNKYVNALFAARKEFGLKPSIRRKTPSTIRCISKICTIPKTYY